MDAHLNEEEGENGSPRQKMVVDLVLQLQIEHLQGSKGADEGQAGFQT